MRKFWPQEKDVSCLETEKNAVEDKCQWELTFGEIELERKYKLFRTIKW